MAVVAVGRRADDGQGRAREPASHRVGPMTAAAETPFVRFLTDPARTAERLVDAIAEAAPPPVPVAVGVVALAGAALACRGFVRRSRHARLSAAARIVTVLAP